MLRRGDGVGIECTRRLVRGVRLDAGQDGRLAAAAEVGITDADDDRAVVDALVRLRAELGDTGGVTRIATFPPASTMHRLDVTGSNGVDLNAVRAQLLREQHITSTLLLDDGPRLWLLAVRWDDAYVRRVEELAERAGFVDVTVEPSPVAIARVVSPRVTRIRRDAATDESFDSLYDSGHPVVAASVDSVGRVAPALVMTEAEFSPGWFDEIEDAVELVTEIRRFVDGLDDRTTAGDPTRLRLAGVAYPMFPPHDLRSPERQCVALGAAVGAAGLTGRLRPVDVILPTVTRIDPLDRPWAVERLSNLPPKPDPATIGPVKRAIGRVLPRRSTKD